MKMASIIFSIFIIQTTSHKRPPKMQRLGGHLWEVVACESRTARAKFLKFNQAWSGISINSKKILKVYLSLPIIGSFIDKIISYSM